MKKSSTIKKLAELEDLFYAGAQLAADLRKGLRMEGRGTALPSTRKGLQVDFEKLKIKRRKTLSKA